MSIQDHMDRRELFEWRDEQQAMAEKRQERFERFYEATESDLAMDATQFVKLVQSMRAAQQAYFRDRSGDSGPHLLQLAKQLERAVDEEIEKANRKETQATFKGF